MVSPSILAGRTTPGRGSPVNRYFFGIPNQGRLPSPSAGGPLITVLCASCSQTRKLRRETFLSTRFRKFGVVWSLAFVGCGAPDVIRGNRIIRGIPCEHSGD